MPRIGRFPPFGKRFFRRARKLVGSCHFSHFWRAVLALAAMQGRRSLRKLEAACRRHRTRQSVGFFLTMETGSRNRRVGKKLKNMILLES